MFKLTENHLTVDPLRFLNGIEKSLKDVHIHIIKCIQAYHVGKYLYTVHFSLIITISLLKH